MAFLTSLRGWVQRQKDLLALDALGSEGRRDIAQDLNLSELTLCGLASRGHGASAELPKMLQALSHRSGGTQPHSSGRPARYGGRLLRMRREVPLPRRSHAAYRRSDIRRILPECAKRSRRCKKKK